MPRAVNRLDSTRLALPGRDWPCLDHWHWHRHRWRCVYLNAPRGEFCAQQIYVYELYDMYAAAPILLLYYMPVTASSLRPILPALTWPENLSSLPQVFHGLHLVLAGFLVHALHTLPSPTATVSVVCSHDACFR